MSFVSVICIGGLLYSGAPIVIMSFVHVWGRTHIKNTRGANIGDALVVGRYDAPGAESHGALDETRFSSRRES